MTAFVPVFAGLVVGNGTVNGAYNVDRTTGAVHFEANVELGSTSHLGDAVALTLRGLPPMELAYYLCLWRATDASTDAIYGGDGAQWRRQLFTLRTFNSYQATLDPVGATVPFTWATGDALYVSGHYLPAVPT